MLGGEGLPSCTDGALDNRAQGRAWSRLRSPREGMEVDYVTLEDIRNPREAWHSLRDPRKGGGLDYVTLVDYGTLWRRGIVAEP